MVAVVAAWVATLHVNLVLWSVLQRKRIGFLWRWLHLPESFCPSVHTFSTPVVKLISPRCTIIFDIFQMPIFFSS